MGKDFDIKEIVADINNNEKLLITGGHFMVSNIDQINRGTIRSFEKAVKLYKDLKGLGYNANLGVFINDIGLTCVGASTCSLEKARIIQELCLPNEFKLVMGRLGIDESEVLILSEKFLRNRAKRLFHKFRKQSDNILEKDEGYYFSTNDRPEIILTRKNNKDKYGTPACPLIMCAFHFEHKRMGFDRSINFYYIENDNLENIPSYIPIEKGKFIASQLCENVFARNFYLGMLREVA